MSASAPASKSESEFRADPKSRAHLSRAYLRLPALTCAYLRSPALTCAYLAAQVGAEASERAIENGAPPKPKAAKQKAPFLLHFGCGVTGRFGVFWFCFLGPSKLVCERARA